MAFTLRAVSSRASQLLHAGEAAVRSLLLHSARAGTPADEGGAANTTAETASYYRFITEISAGPVLVLLTPLSGVPSLYASWGAKPWANGSEPEYTSEHASGIEWLRLPLPRT